MDRDFFDAVLRGLVVQGSSRFIEVLIVDPPDERHPRGTGHPYYAESLDELMPLLTKVFTERSHMYFGVAPRDRKSSRKDDVSLVGSLWVDMDAKDFKNGLTGAMQGILNVVLPPSIIVDSGHGYHAYWLLQQPVTSAIAEAILKELRDVAKGGNVVDCSRRLRIPGSCNVKEGGRAPVRIIRTRYDLVYTAEDISAACKVNARWRVTVLSGNPIGYPSRSERDWAVILALGRYGLSHEAIKTIFRELPVGDKYREQGESYLDVTLNNADERIGQGSSISQSFTEKDCCYFVAGKDEPHRVSSFIFDPKRIFRGGPKQHDVVIGDVYSSRGTTTENVHLPKEAFDRGTTLRHELRNGDWSWLGSDRETQQFLEYLMERLAAKGYPEAQITEVLGRHTAEGEPVWVAKTSVITRSQELDPLQSPIVFRDPGRETPPVVYSLAIDDDEYRELLKFTLELLPQLNVPEVIWPMIGWFFATPFKSVLEEAKIRFPVLNLHGIRGSGKSSLITRVMLPLMGHIDAFSHDCSTTKFVLMTLLSSTNSIPIYLTEFRRTTLGDREFASLLRTLLQMYDVGSDARGRSDQTTTTYRLSAPVVLDGEDAIQDGATLERMLAVELDDATIAHEKPANLAFKKLEKRWETLHMLSGRYVQYSLGFDAPEAAKLYGVAVATVRASVGITISDRIVNNLAIAWFGLTRLKDFCATQKVVLILPEVAVMCESIKNVVNMSTGRTMIAADEFVTEVVNEVNMDRPIKPFIWMYDTEKNTLWFQLSTAFDWWTKKRRMEGRQSLGLVAIRSQLDERAIARNDVPGQYMFRPMKVLVGGAPIQLYGISLEHCRSMGLDIPDSLTIDTVTWVFKREESRKEEAKT